MKKAALDRISESTTYEAYFDLWGFTVGWIDAICDKLHELCEPSKGDNCESYKCEACMAVRFQSTDQTRVEAAKRIFATLEPLARRAMKGKPAHVFYYHP